MKKIIFDSGTEFTIQKPSVKDFIKLFDLCSHGNSSSMLLDEILKHITYPSKEDARKFLSKYIFSVYGTFFSAIKNMCGQEIVDSTDTVVEETEDNKIKIFIDGKSFYFRRLNFVETDLAVKDLRDNKGVVSADVCLKLAMMTVSNAKDTDHKALLNDLFAEYPIAVVFVGRSILDKCSMDAEIKQGE